MVLTTVHKLERANAFVSKPAVSIYTKQRRACPVVVFLETKNTEEQTEQLGLEYLNQGGDNQDPTPPNGNNEDNDNPLIPKNSLVLTAAVLGTVAVAIHAADYAAFFDSLSQMKATMADDPTDFWPAVNFWIFFAVAHAILQPIFWISEVLHASPGPMIGGLVPITFILGNAVVIAAFTLSKEAGLLFVGVE
jgi:hypothetical protein